MNDQKRYSRAVERQHPRALSAVLVGSWVILSLVLLGVVGCDNLNSSASPTDTRPSPDAQPVSAGDNAQSPAGGADGAGGKAAAKPLAIRDTTFDDIKFEMVKTDPFKREMITPAIEDLGGQRIRIRGYILPPYVRTGLDQFVLVRDNQECCFGPGAALFDCVLVKMQPGKTIDYTDLPVAVEGTFRIEQFPPDTEERPLAIYQMVGEAVK